MKLTSVTLMFVATLLVSISNANATFESLAEGIGMDDATLRTSIPRADNLIREIRSDFSSPLADAILDQRVDEVPFTPEIARIQTDRIREIVNREDIAAIGTRMDRAEADFLTERITDRQSRLTDIAEAWAETARRARVDAVGITEPTIRLVG